MNEKKNKKKAFCEIISDAFKELIDTFSAFFKSPRALWGINIPYIVEGLCYFGILTILGKYCSENIGLTDPQAGWVYGGVTGGITFAMLLLGGVVDKIGVRISMILSLSIMAVGRAIISLGGTISIGHGIVSPMFIVTAIGLFFMVCAYGLYQPAAYAGVKRYTNPKTAAVGYAVIYALMNLGAFIFGPISSFTRKHFENIFPPNGITSVFWLLTIFTICATLLAMFIITKKVDKHAVERVKRETDEINSANGKIKENNEVKEKKIEKRKINNLPFIVYLLIAIGFLILFIIVKIGKLNLPNYLIIFLLCVSIILTVWEYIRHRPDHPFRDRKFVFFIFMLIPVQTLFAHNWLTIPYYLDRAFHGTLVGKNFEVFSNLNPLLIFVLAPIIAGLTTRSNIYKMMIIGTFVMAMPTFLLAIGTNTYILLFYILIMTIGEAMWQPRFLQWIAEIAPEGKTGIYMGIGQFPWFLTKVITSLYSGYFVGKYIPKPELGLPLNPERMWLIYAFIAMISPVVLLIAKKWMIKSMTKTSKTL